MKSFPHSYTKVLIQCWHYWRQCVVFRDDCDLPGIRQHVLNRSIATTSIRCMPASCLSFFRLQV